MEDHSFTVKVDPDITGVKEVPNNFQGSFTDIIVTEDSSTADDFG